jgi:alpha-D-ribose 1-methylphosphonate 5-triphosphate synthase subunit PhnH
MLPGFSNSVLSAQSTFRAVMDAFARPGRIVALKASIEPPAPLMLGTAAIALTLFDQDSPVWIDAGDHAAAAATWLRFHTGAPVGSRPADCVFAIVTDSTRLPRFEKFNLGSQDYPDRSTTAIVQVGALRGGPAIQLSGPGIRDRETIAPTSLPGNFSMQLFANRTLFPRGIDLVLVAGSDVIAVPRSLRVLPEA